MWPSLASHPRARPPLCCPALPCTITTTLHPHPHPHPHPHHRHQAVWVTSYRIDLYGPRIDRIGQPCHCPSPSPSPSPPGRVGNIVSYRYRCYTYSLYYTRHQAVWAWPVGPTGLLFDREWALVDDGGAAHAPHAAATTRTPATRAARLPPRLPPRLPFRHAPSALRMR